MVRRQLVIGFMLGLLIVSRYSLADFSVLQAKTRLIDKIYLLEATIDYTLTDKPIEALNSSISLPLVLLIKIQRERWYLWNETVAQLEHRYQLKYYALSRQYALTHLNTGIQQTFFTLESALSSLGTISDFPLIDAHLINLQDANYRIYLKTYLDIESLPVPLRPIAYFSSQWRLASEWYSCPLSTE